MGETKEARAARLGAALRENLRRRKARTPAKQAGEQPAERGETLDEHAARGAEG